MKKIESDVIIIGYGPVSRLLSVMLGRQGHKVTVVERHAYAYPLPRAVCMDHEIHRALHAHGCGKSFSSYGEPSPRYQWLNQDWKTLLDIDWTVESISGGPQAYFFYQPSLEAAIDEEVRKFSNVNILLSHEALDINDNENGVSVEVINHNDNSKIELSGKFLIGADGANSAVRKQLNIPWQDLGFEADWLVVDVLLNDDVELDIPSAGQHCNPQRPTTFVPGGIKDGKRIRRWEIMRLDHEPRELLDDTEYVWKLLSRWVKPDQAQLVRHAVYIFRSLVAEQWSKGKVFLVGDAAHLMPPFMGQGMCSGMRDALNLGWRLDLILKKSAHSNLLNAYEEERKPHITDVINASVFLGNIVCVSDEQKALERDQAFFNGTHPPMAEFPYLKQGTLSDSSHLSVGRLAPHGEIKMGHKIGPMDEVLGSGFILLCKDADTYEKLPQWAHDLLNHINGKLAYVAQDQDKSQHALVDLTNKLSSFFADQEVNVLLVRPDFYVYGVAKNQQEITHLISQLAQSLFLTQHNFSDADDSVVEKSQLLNQLSTSPQ